MLGKDSSLYNSKIKSLGVNGIKIVQNLRKNILKVLQKDTKVAFGRRDRPFPGLVVAASVRWQVFLRQLFFFPGAGQTCHFSDMIVSLTEEHV